MFSTDVAVPEQDLTVWRPGLLRRAAEKRWVRRVIVWSALTGLYEAAAFAAGPFFLPKIEDIAQGAVALALDGALNELGYALIHMIIGFLLAVGVGVPVGIAMGASKLVDYVLGMYVKALFVMSLAALLPILIIVFGFGLVFRVAVVFLFAVFFIILNTAAGVRDVNPEYLAMARAFEVSWLRRMVAVRLPSALPFIVSGARLGLANAFSGMILAELWVTRGLGAIMVHLGLNRDLPKFFALILIVTFLAAFSAAALKALEKRLMPWGEAARGQ